MKVRMNDDKTAASPRGVWLPGQVVDLPEKLARDLVRSGNATAVEPDTAVTETAPETATKAAPRRRGRPRKVTDDSRA